MTLRVGALVALAAVAAACGPLGADGSAVPGSSNGADAGSQGAGPAEGTGPTSTDAAAPGGYSVRGAVVYDSSGNAHRFHGVDRPSLEWSSGGDHLAASDYMRMATWKADVVRIALNQDFWLSDSPTFSSSYATVIDQQVAWAEAAGLDVILDLHWSDKGDYQQMPAQQRMADAHSQTFWGQVAARYKGDGHVLFELYNEPHDVPWDVWLNGGASGNGFMVVGMQDLYDTVRQAGAENLVLIGGLQFAFDLSGVPLHRVQGHNIVWATHPYNQNGKQMANWDTAFGNLAMTDPVMATEFGDTTGCGTNYYSQLIAYADAHGVSWSGWAWYVSGCQFPSIISDWSGTPTAAGQVEKAALEGY
ncbi:MAG TPA: cellulase family glycosylhydrolase [Polyangiaceae bacterium]|nr:cellulase family glycosylhydrolase [Polyangiaceae bacterium]